MRALSNLHRKIVACPLCRLCETRTHAVPGEGDPEADVMFVGEAPGKSEDAEGRPFVGMAGRYLERMLSEIDWSREEVFITNIVKCRPPHNRDPRSDEIDACRPYLERQIDLIRPRLIVTLGRHALDWFLPGLKISKVQGKLQRGYTVPVLPLYHPAGARRSNRRRAAFEAAFKRIPKVVRSLEG